MTESQLITFGSIELKYMFTSEISRRLLAGMWFAIAAVIPVVYFFLCFSPDYIKLPFSDGSSILTVAVPMFVAGICGLLFGADILDRDNSMTALEAVGRGTGIGLLSYLLLFSGSAVIFSLGSGDTIGIIVFFGFIFLYGLFFIGWLIGLTGAAAGGLLFLYRLKTAKR